MSAELSACAQRSFQIHERTDFEKLKIRQSPAFLKHVELNELEFPARKKFYRRQTPAIDRHTAADFQTARRSFGGNRQRNRLRATLDFFDRSSFFNDACEHGIILMVGRDSIEPCLINLGCH